MASLKDLVHVIRSHGLLKLCLRVYHEVNKDNVFTNAAAMAYAWVFAVFPLIIFLMTLVPYLPDELREKTPKYVTDVMYGAGLQYAIVGPVEDLVKTLLTKSHSGLLSFGLILTLYAASGGMNTTMAGLDAALDVDNPRPFWLKRLIAMGLTIFMGLAFVIVLLMLPIGSQATSLLLDHRNMLPDAVQSYVSTSVIVAATIVRYAIGITVIQIMIGVLYFAGPSRTSRMRFFSPGGLFTAVGWIATGYALRFYFGHFDSYSKTYGTVAGAVIMLLVFYVDATLILIGAEINNEVVKARYEEPETPIPA